MSKTAIETHRRVQDACSYTSTCTGMQYTAGDEHRATKTVHGGMNRTSFTTAPSRSDASCVDLVSFPLDTFRIFSDLSFDSSVALFFTSQFHCLSVTSGGLRCFMSIIRFSRNRLLINALLAFLLIHAWSMVFRWPSPLTSHAANTYNTYAPSSITCHKSCIQLISVNHAPRHLQHACCDG